MARSRENQMMLPRSLSEPGSQTPLSLVVGVVGDFCGSGVTAVGDPSFVEIDHDNFDHVLSCLGPELQFKVASTLEGGESQMLVRLRFETMDDFLPARVAEQVPALSKLLETRKRMTELAKKISSSDSQPRDLQKLLDLAGIPAGSLESAAPDVGPPAEPPAPMKGATSLLDAVIDETRMPGDVSGVSTSTSLGAADAHLRELLLGAAEGTTFVPKNVRRAVDEAIMGLDLAASRQLAQIMHHPDFQRLEGSWRGLKFLVFYSETSTNLKIKVCQCPLERLRDSFLSTDDIQRTMLFRLLYERPLEAAGEEPFALLIGDYEFGPGQADAALLRNIADVAAMCLCPFVAAASPSFFELESWDQILSFRTLDWINDSPDHIKWNSFRDRPEALYVTLTLPRMLARPPYEASVEPSGAFEFQEFAIDPRIGAFVGSHDSYLWTSSAYALGACVTRAYAETGWCVDVCGVDGGGLVTGFPTRSCQDTDSGLTYGCSIETRMPSGRDAELSMLGFTPLTHLSNRDAAAFLAPRSVYRPRKFTNMDQTANERIAARLPCILATSRVAQHVRVIIQSRSGHVGSRAELEAGLNAWLGHYVGEPDQAPLHEGSVKIRVDDADGGLVVELKLRPYLCIEELTQPITIVL